MKMMLSMPSTSSSAVNVKNAIQTCGSDRRAAMASMSAAILAEARERGTLRQCSNIISRLFAAFVFLSLAAPATARLLSGEVHVWEVQEITSRRRATTRIRMPTSSAGSNSKGPDFHRRVYGFWDGGRTFKVRFVATQPGEWTWRAGSQPPTIRA